MKIRSCGCNSQLAKSFRFSQSHTKTDNFKVDIFHGGLTVAKNLAGSVIEGSVPEEYVVAGIAPVLLISCGGFPVVILIF